MVKPAFAGDPAAYDWLVEKASEVNRRLAKMDTSAFVIGYCHFDFLPHCQ
jgi:hypothetical protein